MYKYSILFIFMLTFSLQAQLTAEKMSIDSGGGMVTVGTLVSLSTLGEGFVEETANGNLQISEGFISAGQLTSLGLDAYDPLLNVALFPNPTQDFVNIKSVENVAYTLTLYDTHGRKIELWQIDTTEYQINVAQLPTATYWLVLTDELNQQYKSFSLIKK